VQVVLLFIAFNLVQSLVHLLHVFEQLVDAEEGSPVLDLVQDFNPSKVFFA